MSQQQISQVSLHSQQQQQNQQQGSQLEDINDLDELFESLKIEKQGRQEDQIEKSTLLALLLYLNIDKSDAYFFNQIVKSLDQIQSTTLNKNQFKNLFLDPQINVDNLKSDEYEQIFSVFNQQKKGPFTADDFIKLYKETKEYQNLNQNDKQQVEARIRKDFEIISHEHKEFSPIEFFKMINNQV